MPDIGQLGRFVHKHRLMYSALGIFGAVEKSFARDGESRTILIGICG